MDELMDDYTLASRERTERSRRRRGGLSLVEVMIALVVLAFGLLGVAAAQVSSLRFTSQSRLRTEAQYLAEQQMEVFQGMMAADLDAAIADPNYPDDPNNPIDPDLGDAEARNFLRSWAITPDVPENGVYTITVQVAWVNPHGGAQTVTLDGVRSGL